MSPNNDGKMIRLQVPPMSRRAAARRWWRASRSRREDAKVACRNIRRDANKHFDAGREGQGNDRGRTRQGQGRGADAAQDVRGQDRPSWRTRRRRKSWSSKQRCRTAPGERGAATSSTLSGSSPRALAVLASLRLVTDSRGLPCARSAEIQQQLPDAARDRPDRRTRSPRAGSSSAPTA